MRVLSGEIRTGCGFAWEEHNNRPCGIGIYGERVSVYPPEEFKCFNSVKLVHQKLEIDVQHFVKLNDAYVGRLEVCNNNSCNKRFKGAQIWGDVVNPDGTTTYRPDSDTEELPNCEVWRTPAFCNPGQLATGIVVHANDLSGGKAEIVGLQLI